jgi:fumarate reductase flavoprotein subunit
MGIGNYAAARIPGRIVKAQSLAVDSVSGATITSSAVKAAVAQAIKDAGGDLAAFQKAPSAAPVVKESVTRKVDVVIAGAGTSGLMAAARLAEQGKSVLVFEKQDIPGGSMAMTYGGVLSSGTKSGAAYGLGREKKDLYWSKDLLLNVLKSYIRPQFDRFNKAMPYKSASLDASGPMVDWMRDIGIGFEPLGKYEGGLQLGIEPYLAPGCYQGGAGYAAMFLADRIVAKGGTIVYATPVTSLKIEGGRVIGLKAEGKDGKSWDVDAGAVLLATGGFAANKEMIARYYPDYKDQAFNCAVGNTGDGIEMGLKAGSVVECTDRQLGAFPAVHGSNYEVAFINMIVPGLMVNGDGAKVADTSHVGLGKAKLDPANKGRFYYVFDDEGVEALKKSMTYGFSYASVFDRGEAVKYSSVEEAARKLALPGLVAAVADNNKNAQDKKPRFSYLETRDGIWLIRIDPSFYLTTGGLAIDTESRVLDKAGKAIPGLYAAGDVAGSVEEKDGLAYGYGFDSAATFGYIAAATIDKDK